MNLLTLLIRVFLPLTMLCAIAVYLLYMYDTSEPHPYLVATEVSQQPVSPSNIVQRKDKAPLLPKTLPYAKYLKSIDDIQRASWITQLYEYLTNLKLSSSPHVNMVFGDSH